MHVGVKIELQWLFHLMICLYNKDVKRVYEVLKPVSWPAKQVGLRVEYVVSLVAQIPMCVVRVFKVLTYILPMGLHHICDLILMMI